MSDLIISETDREYCTECREGFENNPKFTIHPDCLDHIKGVNYDNLCPQCGNPAIASFKTCLKCNSGHVFVNYQSIFESRLKRLQIRYTARKGAYLFVGLMIGFYFAFVATISVLRDLHIAILVLLIVYLRLLKKYRPEKYQRFGEKYKNWLDRNWTQPMLFELIEELDEIA